MQTGLAGEILRSGGSLESCFSYLDVVPLETGLGASRETARKRWIHTILLKEPTVSANIDPVAGMKMHKDDSRVPPPKIAQE